MVPLSRRLKSRHPLAVFGDFQLKCHTPLPLYDRPEPTTISSSVTMLVGASLGHATVSKLRTRMLKLWELLPLHDAAGVTTDHVVGLLMDAYDVEQSVCHAEVTRLLAAMVDAGVASNVS